VTKTGLHCQRYLIALGHKQEREGLPQERIIMKRGDTVKVTDLRDNTARVGVYTGSGDWGIRFTFPGSSFRGFEVTHDEWLNFDMEVVSS